MAAPDPGELAGVAGAYAGEGAWYDEASQSKPYAIELRIELLADGGLRKWFRHDFHQEATATEQTLLLRPVANGVLALGLDGTPFGGRGYFGGQVLHYEIDMPSNRVESTLVFDAFGGVVVAGSAQRNAQGRFIWWRERLRRLDG